MTNPLPELKARGPEVSRIADEVYTRYHAMKVSGQT